MIYLFLLVALLSLIFVVYVVRGESVKIRNFRDLEGHTETVDMPAFRNLTDSAEEAFLRAHLPAREFRAIQRMRLLATVEYVWRAARNAAVLIRLGEAAQKSTAPEVSRVARKLVEDAIRVRVVAFLVIGKLYVRYLLPGARLSTSRFAGRYEAARENVAYLVRLECPSHAATVCDSL